MIYLNVVVNVIKKLRGEAVEAAKKKPPAATNHISRDVKPNLVTTHLQVLAGKPGTVGTWSIEKKTQPKLVRLSILTSVGFLLFFGTWTAIFPGPNALQEAYLGYLIIWRILPI